MNQKIKPGDLVTLKSGSDLMTVNSVDESGKCECVYFYDDELKVYTLSAEALEIDE